MQQIVLKARPISYWKGLSLDERKQQIDDYRLYDESNPAVYVGTYHKYNCGSIAGAWLDLSMFESYEEFEEVCRILHADEDEPEFMFQDFMNFPEDWYCESFMGEYDFYKIQEFAELDEDKRKIFMAYEGYANEDDIDTCFDRYQGEYDSMEDFAEYLVSEMDLERQLGNWIQYFDYKAFARDLENDYFMVDDYVFSYN